MDISRIEYEQDCFRSNPWTCVRSQLQGKKTSEWNWNRTSAKWNGLRWEGHRSFVNDIWSSTTMCMFSSACFIYVASKFCLQWIQLMNISKQDCHIWNKVQMDQKQSKALWMAHAVYQRSLVQLMSQQWMCMLRASAHVCVDMPGSIPSGSRKPSLGANEI